MKMGHTFAIITAVLALATTLEAYIWTLVEHPFFAVAFFFFLFVTFLSALKMLNHLQAGD